MKKITTFIKQNYWLISILLLASFLRIFHADFQSIWLDEIHTMIESNPALTLREFYDVINFREGMGHLYFFLVRMLHAIFGYSTLTARLFSVFTGIATVYTIYLLGKVVYNKRVGLIAALLLTVNLYHITYSQEARPYALLVFFCILSFYRLALLLKNPSLRNAFWYGVFTGFMVNAHFVSLITIGGQGLLIVFVLMLLPKEQKARFLKHSSISGITALILMLPTYPIFLKMTRYNSGWLTLPGPDGFSRIVREFTGDTELLWFLFLLLAIFYFVNLFRQKGNKLSAHIVLSNNLIFCSLLLFCWMFFSIPLSIIKSYLDEPMILSRYFIHLLPALILLFAVAIELIRNRISQILIISMITILSLTDIFIVKDYYYKISKTQYREIAPEIKAANKADDKIVSAYGWLYSYFFDKDKPVLEMKLEDYVAGMREGTIPMSSFWYMDGNHRPYSLSEEDTRFLEENFKLQKSLQKFDVWAKYYISKKYFTGSIGLQKFKPLLQDEKGNLLFFENSTIKSSVISLKQGRYKLVLKGNSHPKISIKGENAHLTIKLDGKEISSLYLSEKPEKKENIILFEVEADKRTSLQITFDNDTFEGNADRNAIIYSIAIEKQE